MAHIVVRFSLSALLFVAGAGCQAPPSDATPLDDLTLASEDGKSDGLGQRTLVQRGHEERYLGAEQEGEVRISDVTSTRATAEGPLYVFARAPGGAISAEIGSRTESWFAPTFRMRLFYRKSPSDPWTKVSLLVNQRIGWGPVTSSRMEYFKRVEIGDSTISITNGQGTFDTPNPAGTQAAAFALFPFPVNVWGGYADTYGFRLSAECDGHTCE